MAAMNHDRRPEEIHEPEGRPRWWRGRRAVPDDTPAEPVGLRVKSLDRSMTEAQALSSSDLLVLLTEDCCWQAATDHWRRRRPPLWRRSDRRGWRAEGRVLRDKSRRLRELGAELGLGSTERAGQRPRFGHDDH
jgi:hypothetical protein